MSLLNNTMVCDYCGHIIRTNVSEEKYVTYINAGSSHKLTLEEGIDLCPKCSEVINIKRVDNFNEIGQMLKFESENDFYFVQILQRKKDGCDTSDSSNNGYRVIKSYYIKSLEEFERRKPKIVELCESNNARAYININRRNTEECCWEAVNKYMELLRNKHTHQGYKVWDHACGVSKSVDKMWMVDVDKKGKDNLAKICSTINECRGKNENHIINILHSLHGFHIITEGFDLAHFKQLLAMYDLDNVDVHKQGIVLLYYLNGLSS